MFAENEMLGMEIKKTDEKGRIMIPSYTGCEVGEFLALVKEYGILKLTQQQQVLDELKFLESKIKLCDKHNDIIDATNEYVEYAKSILTQSKVDTYRRFNSHGNLKPNQAYKVIGVGNKVVIIEHDEEKTK